MQMHPTFTLLYTAFSYGMANFWDQCCKRRQNVSDLCNEYSAAGHYSAGFLTALDLKPTHSSSSL
jgi:hypothetical protein